MLGLVVALATPAAAYIPDDLSLDPLTAPTINAPDGDDHTEEDATDVPAPPPARASLADVRYGADGLPGAVASARNALMEAARAGEIEALRPVFDAQRAPPIVTPYENVPDAVAHLKRQSGDAAGREILAILLELLEGGHVAVGEGSARTFVWPYFAEVPIGELKPRHFVELYRILTSIDVEEMERLGQYTFFRVGISADGRVRYFSAGPLED
ncbi:MAG: hypothetical protein AAF318_12910 [Pseudomonadota bacterium]